MLSLQVEFLVSSYGAAPCAKSVERGCAVTCLLGSNRGRRGQLL